MVKTRNLITGGAGFLGSNLIERLLKKKEYVICLDNCFTGRKRNIQKFLHSEDFKFIDHDVLDPINLNVDRIWHLACPASPKLPNRSSSNIEDKLFRYIQYAGVSL